MKLKGYRGIAGLILGAVILTLFARDLTQQYFLMYQTSLLLLGFIVTSGLYDTLKSGEAGVWARVRKSGREYLTSTITRRSHPGLYWYSVSGQFIVVVACFASFLNNFL